jgi:hypothetical protein
MSPLLQGKSILASFTSPLPQEDRTRMARKHTERKKTFSNLGCLLLLTSRFQKTEAAYQSRNLFKHPQA